MKDEDLKRRQADLKEMKRELERKRIDKIRQKAFDQGFRAGYAAGRSSLIPEEERKG